MSNAAAVESPASPVYVPWTTFLSALDTLHRNGIPASGKIDKSMWDTQSGAIQSQLILAFKFLGLIDGQKHVLPALPPLAKASAEERKPMLKRIIEEKYKRVIVRDLTTITPSQFDEAFREMGVNGSTLDRATRFFVKACTELGIPIAKRFSERAKSQSVPRKKRATNASRYNEDQNPPARIQQPHGSWEEQLLSKFPQFDPDWPDELKVKWFAGFERLMGTKPNTE